MNKKLAPGSKNQSPKGGHRGTQMWTAHRLEGVNQNRATKMIRKPKKGSK